MFKTTAYLGVPDDRFHEAVQRFMVTDTEARRRVQAIIDGMQGRWRDRAANDEAIAQVQREAIDPLNTAVWSVHQAANAVVYSGHLELPKPH